MADGQLNIRIVVDTSQADGGMKSAAASVETAATRMAASLKNAGVSAEDATSAMKNLGFGSEETAQALSAVGMASNVAAPALDRTAASANNARSAMMGLNREIGLGGNRALSTFVAQSEMIGPVLSKAFTGIAIVGFIQLATLAGEKLSALIADTYIFTDAQKALYSQIVGDSQKIVQLNEQHQKALRDIAVVGLPLAQQEQMRAQWAKQDADALKSQVEQTEKQLSLATQQLSVLQKQREAAQSQTVTVAKVGTVSADQGQFDKGIADAEAEVTRLSSSLAVLRAQYTVAADAAEGMSKRSGVEQSREHARAIQEEYDRVFRLNEAMQRLQNEADRLRLAQEQLDREQQALGESAVAKQTEEQTHALEQLSEAQRQVAEERLRDVERDAVAEIDIQEQQVQEQFRLGQLSAAQTRDRLNALAAQKLQIELDYLNKLQKPIQERIATEEKANAEDLKEWQKLQSQKLEAQRQFNAQVEKNNETSAIHQITPLQRAFQSLEREMDGLVRNFLEGTTSIGGMFRRLAGDILMTMIEAFARLILEQLAYTATAGLIGKEHAFGDIMRSAYQAAAKVYAEVPFPMNVPVAGAVFATVVAMGGSLPSAAGGMIVPNDTLAMVHKNEMVLPAGISQGLQGLIGAGASGGNTTIHIHAMDAQSFAEFLDRDGNANAIAAKLQQRQRLFR